MSLLGAGIMGSGVLALLFGLSGNTGAASAEKLAPVRSGPTRGPLQVSRSNPRYFVDATGRVVYLTGSHTWANLLDAGPVDPPPVLDYTRYLDFLVSLNHNFFRMWTSESTKAHTDEDPNIWITPLPFQRTGPGLALDKKPKFDLTKLNQDYFDRLRARTIQAGQRGIYVSVMFFQGWSADDKERGSGRPWRAWLGSPYHRSNNVNGIDGDSNRDGSGDETHTLKIPEITRIEETYVRKVIDSVGDLDNVLYEISNESRSGSRDWQYHMVNLVRAYEASKGWHHPIGMTVEFPDGDNSMLREGPADWISPNGSLDDVPPADGKKVVLLDTDHLCGICGDRMWAWKSFTRGYNVLLMDPYDGRNWGIPQGYWPDHPTWVSLRRTLGYTLAFADRMDLSRARPRLDLSDTTYCLAAVEGPSPAYVVYRAARKGAVTVDLRDVTGPLAIEWLDPQTGSLYPGAPVSGGEKRAFVAPFNGDAVLFIHGTSTPSSPAGAPSGR